jgi:NAD(P)H-hydrate epimerase
MASGGMGDILTGMAAGLWAQGLHRQPASPSAESPAWAAIVTAVYLHGLAGDVARERQGELALTATDLLTALPEAVRRVQASAREKYVWLNEPFSPVRS